VDRSLDSFDKKIMTHRSNKDMIKGKYVEGISGYNQFLVEAKAEHTK
jgi:hypothetical protein